MKKIICTVLSFLFVVSLCACSKLNNTSGIFSSDNATTTTTEEISSEQKDTTQTQNSSQSATQSKTDSKSSSKTTDSEAVTSSKDVKTDKSENSKKSETSKLVEKDLGNAITKTVDITIPAEFFELSEEPFNYQLTAEDKANGFTDIKKNKDGSATYTIKEDNYKKFISELKAEAKKSIDELATDGTFTSIKSIDYNDDLSEIIITADKSKFENSFDSLAVMSCGMTAYFYRIYDVEAKPNCVIKVKDISGTIFKTETYPQ